MNGRSIDPSASGRQAVPRGDLRVAMENPIEGCLLPPRRRLSRQPAVPLAVLRAVTQAVFALVAI